MNVGLFADCYTPTASGVVTSLLQHKGELEQRGHRIVVVTVANGPRKEQEGTIYRVPSLPFNRASGFRLGLANQRAVNRLVREENLDLIHTHTEYSLGWAGRRAARHFGLPLVHTAHTLHPAYRHYLPLGERLPPGLVRGYVHRFLSPYDVIVCPSRKAQRYVQAVRPTQKTIVIPNGLDRDRFYPRPLTKAEKRQVRRELGLSATDRVLLFVGRLGPEKRVMELLAALLPLLREQPRLKLLLVGSGRSRASLQRAARDSGCLGQILFIGAVPWTDTHCFYALADLFVTASLSEIHPMTLIEAATCGLPIVARRDEAYADLVIDDYNGYLAESDRQLAGHVATLLADRERHNAFARHASTLSRKFDTQTNTDRIEALYQSLVARA